MTSIIRVYGRSIDDFVAIINDGQVTSISTVSIFDVANILRAVGKVFSIEDAMPYSKFVRVYKKEAA